MWEINNFRLILCRFYRNTAIIQWFVNSDDCIEKNTSKSIKLKPVFIQKNIRKYKKQIFYSEKMKNSGDRIFDYAHTFFGKDF